MNETSQRPDIPAILASSEYLSVLALLQSDENWRTAITSSEGVACIHELIRTRAPRTALEIGTYEGCTAHAMARALHLANAGVLHTVSPFDAERFLPRFERWPAEIRAHVRFHAVSSMDFYILADREQLRFDFAFVDGNHDYEFAGFDIQAIARRMTPGGLLLVDNVEQPGPYFAALDFLATNPGWTAVELKTARPAKAYDNTRRTSANGFSFAILQAPTGIVVGDRPYSSGQVAWHTDTVKGVTLAHDKNGVDGDLIVQCLLRGFGVSEVVEVITETTSHVSGNSATTVNFGPVANIGEFERYSIELCLSWSGSSPLGLSAEPIIF